MTTWFGFIWCTRRQRWEKVCQGDGLGACARKLGEIARVRGVKDRHTAMTTGAVPRRLQQEPAADAAGGNGVTTQTEEK